MRLSGFIWVVPRKLAGMPLPLQSEDEAAELKRRGIGAVVNLTAHDWPARVLKEAGLAYLQLPIIDFSPPTHGQVDRFVEFCDVNIRSGKPVVVHCVAGRGRTGTMIACYLVHEGMDAEQAIRHVREARSGSIETPGQERAVREYAARCRKEAADAEG